MGTVHADLDVSYLADTAVLLRYFECEGAIRQVISVVKQRVGRHERTLREFFIHDTGISVGEPLNNLRGVLTGVPELVHAVVPR